MSKKMYYESEKTLLLYLNSNKQEKKLTLPLINVSVLVNKPDDSIMVILDNVIQGLGKKANEFCLNITNDPFTDHKYSLTNLGYYSVRLTGSDCDIFHLNNKTIFKFDITKFNNCFNLPLYLPKINNESFWRLFEYNNQTYFFYRFEFDECTYKINTYLFKDDYLSNFNMNLNKIEDNYKLKTYSKNHIQTILRQFNIM